MLKKGIDYTGISIVFLCHDGKGNFLLQKRSKNCRDEHHCWDGGAGGLDFADTIEETLIKEIKEEYCSSIISYEFLGIREVFREHNKNKTHWIAFDHLVHIDRSKVKNGEPHKFEEIGWFRLDEFPKKMHSVFPTFYNKYKERILELTNT